jgi:hypothetical protein
MIVETPRNTHDLASFSFPGHGIPRPTMSMPVTQFGALRKMIIAAGFDVRVPVGWPELQIIRRANNGTCNVVFMTNATEPKPTGYLNIYEYNLTATNFNIQIGDTLNIAWHGNTLQPNQMRFSLAYYKYNGSSPVPMVSIVVGDCYPATDLLTLDTLYCEENSVTAMESVTTIQCADMADATAKTSTIGSTISMSEETTSTTQASTNQIASSATNDSLKIISGVVVFSAFFILLLILLFVFILVVKRRRKSASMNVTDPIEMSTQPQMLHNTPSKSTNKIDETMTLYSLGDERGPALENDYLESDDRAPSDSAPALVTAMAYDNQQDVRIAHHGTGTFRLGPCTCFASSCVCTFDLVTGLLLLQAVRVGSVCTNSGEFQFLLHTGMYYTLYNVTPPKTSLYVLTIWAIIIIDHEIYFPRM